MSSVNEIEAALTRLSLEDLQSVRDWLEHFIAEQVEGGDTFKANIEGSKKQVTETVEPVLESFPPGSLADTFTEARNEEELLLLKGSVLKLDE